MKASIFLRIFTVAIVLLMTIRVAAAAEAAPAVSSLVRVPVYFITDRNMITKDSPEGPQFGPHRKYVGECLHDPYMGFGYYVVKSETPLTANQKAVGWTAAAPEDKEGAYKLSLIEGADFDKIQDSFYGKLKASALASSHRDIVLFAHGYKNSFADALHTASRFSHDFEQPVILYSWPSVSKLRSYTSDENNVEWSQEHYNDVIQKLEQLCDSNASLHLRIFAHSMGCRLFVRAAPFLREKRCVTEAAVVCPDVDRGLVRHYAKRYFSVNGTCKIRLYMSQRDKALVLSQLVHGGYTRLGECAESLATMVSQVVPINGEKKESTTTDKALDARINAAKDRMQTIDFTALDTGLVGHKIPVELIHSMSYTGKPGPGLVFEKEAGDERNRSSRLLSKLARLQTTPTTSAGGLMPADSTLRVIRSKPGDSSSVAGLQPTAK